MHPTEILRDEVSLLIFTDDLTGLYNRRFMYRYLTEQVDWKGEQPELLSLIMIDLDSFKSINDTYGHLEGDHVLKQTAQVLRESFSDAHIVVRYAGDEFCVLLPKTGRQETLRLAEQMRERLAQTEFTRGGKKVKGAVSLSAGLATFPEDARTPEELIDRADKALYFSKIQGRNKVSDAVQMERDQKKVSPDQVPIPLYTADQDQVAAVLNLLAAAQDGQNQFVFIRGGLGVGKIRFLGEVVKQVEGAGARCIVEKCNPHEKRAPYRPLIELLDKYLYKNVNEIEHLQRNLSEPELIALADEIPTLSKFKSDRSAGGSISPEQRRLLFFDGLVKTLVVMSQEQLLLVVLDGLQYADEGTLNVLLAILGGHQGRIIFCGALESGATGEVDVEKAGLKTFMDQVQQMERFHPVVLEPLGQTEISEFISQLLPGRQPMADFDRMVWEIGRGGRLYTEIAIQVMISRKIIRFENDQWVIEAARLKELPTTLDGLVRSQITLLDKQTEEIITEAAVIGTNFRLDLLKRVAGTNEGEMLDLLDKAKQLKLVDSPQRFNMDELHFISPEAQQATYESIDENIRREAHEHVAEAVQDLYKDRLDQAAAQLAFHYEKAGDEKKAQEFQELAQERAGRVFHRDEIEDHVRKKKGTRTRLKERDLALSDKETALVMHALRTLSTASKNLYLYPEGSLPIQQAVQQLQDAMHRSLAKMDGFTVADTKEGLRINNKVLDAKTAEVMYEQILRAMHDRYIRSMTFIRGVDQVELQSFAKLFGQPPPKGMIDRNYWDMALDKYGIMRIGVVQRAYVLEAQKARDTGTLLRIAQKSLSEETLHRAALVIRGMSAAVDNMRLYPAESSIIVYALEQLERSVKALFEQCDGINFSEAEGSLLVNGVPANPKILGAGAADLARILRQAGLKSCAIVPDVTPEEIKVFLKLLAEATGPAKIDEWRARMADRRVAHIWVGDTLYTAAQAGAPPPPKPTVKIDPRALTGEAAVQKARELCEADLSQLLSAEVISILPQLLEILVLDRHMDLLKTLMGKYSEILLSQEGKDRDRAAEALTEIHDKSGSVTREAILSLIQNGVVESLRNEKLAGTYRKLLQLGSHVARQCAERKEYESMNRVVSAMGRQRIADDLKKELGGLAKETLTALLNSPSVQSLLNELKSPDFEVQSKVLHILSGFGTAAVPILIRLIKETEDYSIRRFAARAIRASGSESVAVLLKEVTRYAPAEPCRRIIGVLDELGEDVIPLVKQTIVHQDEVVRWESLLLIKRLDRRAGLEVLLSVAGLEDPQMSVFAIQALGELRFTEAVQALSDVLKQSKDPAVMKAVCVALGTMADPSAVPVLREVATRRGFLGLKPAYPDDIRASSAWALGRMTHPEAHQIIERLMNDKSPAVKSAAKLALGK